MCEHYHEHVRKYHADNKKRKKKYDKKNIKEGYDGNSCSSSNNIGNDDINNKKDNFEFGNENCTLPRNNTADFTPQRYDTDQTINFECIEEMCQKRHGGIPFYSFLKRPKIKIKNKLFNELRRARSHESYVNKEKVIKKRDYINYNTLKKRMIRKEREGELYIMIFNTCRELYKKLYVNGFISGECLLTLTSILDLSADFAIKKVRMNPIKAWADAFDKGRKHKRRSTRRNSIDHRNGFEYEFHILLSKLKINKKNFFFFSPKVVNIFLVYEH